MATKSILRNQFILRDYISAAAVIPVLFFHLPLIAQESNQRIEEIIVTGSYIRRDNFNLPSPVQVISQIDIEEEGLGQLGDVIKNLTFNYGTANVSNPVAGQQAYDSVENLRGIGGTLTLLDGRRAVINNANLHYPPIAIERIEILKDGASALYGNEAIAGVINYIPNKTFEGFKMSLYGLTDDDNDYGDGQLQAIFGRDFGGTHVVASAEYRTVSELSQLERPDYVETSFARSSVSNPGTYAIPRRIANDLDGDGFVSADEISIGRSIVERDPGCGNPAVTSTDVTKPNSYSAGLSNLPGGRANCFMDFREYYQYMPSYDTLRSAFTVTHEFDRVQLFGEMLYTQQDRTSTQTPSFPGGRLNQLPQVVGDHPGNPYRAFVDRNDNGIIDESLANPSANETLFAQDLNGNGIPDRDINGDGIADIGAEANAAAQVLLAPNPFDPLNGIPFNEDVTVARLRPVGKGPFGLPDVLDSNGAAEFESKVDEVRLTGGAEFDLPFSDWSASTSYTLGQVKENFNFRSHAFSPIVSGLTASVVDNEVVGGLNGRFYNPFSTAQYTCVNRICDGTLVDPASAAFITPEVANAITFPSKSNTKTRFSEFNLVASGSLFSINSRSIEAAVGVHARSFEEKNNFPQHENDCDGWRVECLADDKIEAKSSAAFFEILVPVLEHPRWGDMELQLAGRYSVESEADAESFDPKVAIRYQPVDWLALRSSWGTSFVAPQVQDQTINSSPAFGHDVTCDVTALCPTTNVFFERRNIPNAGLEPEQSESWNTGFTLQLLNGDLTIDTDYIHIDFDERFTSQSVGDVLGVDQIRFQSFYDANIGTLSAEEIRNRWIDPGNKSTGDFESQAIIRGLDTSLQEVVTLKTINAQSVQFEGVDINLNYRFTGEDLPWLRGNYGDFRLRLDASYVEKFEYQANVLSEVAQASGQRNDGTGLAPPMPRWRANARLSWFRNNHGLVLTGRYTHHVRDDSNFVTNPAFARNNVITSDYISSRTTWDLQYNLRMEGLLAVGGDTTFTLGGINIFETMSNPVFGIGGIESLLHDPRGRLVYLRLTQEF